VEIIKNDFEQQQGHMKKYADKRDKH